MFFLISHSRPELCLRALRHIEAVGCESKGMLIVNGSSTGYVNMPVPKNWKVKYMPKNLGYCGAMNWAFTEFPNESFYGMIGDDEIVKTRDWDTKLIAAAGDWNIAHSNDGWQSHRRIHGYAAFGGELVRSIGYLAPQGLWHWYIDNVWEDLSEALGIKRMCTDVSTEHLHYIAGKAPKDKTYELGESRAEQDAEIYRRWRQNDFPGVVSRVRHAMDSRGLKVVYDTSP